MKHSAICCSNVENGGARVQHLTAAEDMPEGRLFGDRRATKPLLSFLVTTNVVSRRGKETREAEMARRDNILGLELLEDELD
jgi:hypothetical protein